MAPCGTGSSARLALLHPLGHIQVGGTLTHQPITGGRFSCTIESITEVGPYNAVVPVIAGQAWITGPHQTGLDPTDPHPHGFAVADTWMTTM